MCCFFFKQKTAYEMRISDWSSDVCSSDLADIEPVAAEAIPHEAAQILDGDAGDRGFSAAARPGVGMLAVHQPAQHAAGDRSEERRVGKECVSTCRSPWSPYH